MNRYLLTIILGALVGTMGGMEGQAGDLQILTGLLLFGIVKTQRQAAGTTLLFNTIPFMWAAAYEYYQRGDLDIKISAILVITSMIFSYLGARLNYMVSPVLVNYSVAVTSTLAGAYFFYRAYKGMN